MINLSIMAGNIDIPELNKSTFDNSLERNWHNLSLKKKKKKKSSLWLIDDTIFNIQYTISNCLYQSPNTGGLRFPWTPSLNSDLNTDHGKTLRDRDHHGY